MHGLLFGVAPSVTKRPFHPLDFPRHAGLEAGTNAHYTDADYYTSAYENRSEDLSYYLELASAQHGDVLEYGCGNGRIALPMARSGLAVWGVDRAPLMLADLKRKLRRERAEVRARLTVRRGDMRKLRLKRTFSLVLCTFNTWLHLYTRRDVEQFCARVRDHLKRGGRFVVDVSVPDPDEMMRDPARLFRSPRFKHPSTGEWVRYGERFDYDSASQVLTIAMEFEPQRSPEQSWMTPLAHRQFFPQEMEALLHYNGLPVIDVHANFDSEASLLGATSLIYHCRRR